MRTCIIRILLQECVRGGRMQCVSNTVGCYCRTSRDTKFRDCNKFRVWESIQIWHRSWIKANSESPLLCGVLWTQKIRLSCWKLVHLAFACIWMMNKEVGSLFYREIPSKPLEHSDVNIYSTWSEKEQSRVPWVSPCFVCRMLLPGE